MEPQYLEQITSPMDLGTIAVKMKRKGTYRAWNDYAADIELMINNMLRYYDTPTKEYKSAWAMRELWNVLQDSVCKILNIERPIQPDDISAPVVTTATSEETPAGDVDPTSKMTVEDNDSQEVPINGDVAAASSDVADPKCESESKQNVVTTVSKNDDDETIIFAAPASKKEKKRSRSPDQVSSKVVPPGRTETPVESNHQPELRNGGTLIMVAEAQAPSSANGAAATKNESSQAKAAGGVGIPSERPSGYVLSLLYSSRTACIVIKKSSAAVHALANVAASSSSSSAGTSMAGTLASLLKGGVLSTHHGHELAAISCLPTVPADRKLRIALSILCDPQIQQMLSDFAVSRIQSLLQMGSNVQASGTSSKVAISGSATVSAMNTSSKLRLPSEDMPLCLCLQLLQLKWQHEFPTTTAAPAPPHVPASTSSEFAGQLVAPQDEMTRVLLPLLLVLVKTGDVKKDDMLTTLLHHPCVETVGNTAAYFGDSNTHVLSLLTHIIDKVM
jgi:hypothetical protein